MVVELGNSKALPLSAVLPVILAGSCCTDKQDPARMTNARLRFIKRFMVNEQVSLSL
jgi:hypothetical protein